MGSLAHAGTRPGIAAASFAKSHCGPPSRPTLDASRHRSARLAASLALALNVPGLVEAGTVTVTRCNDQDGIQYFGNSLRLAINIAVDGDTVDLSGLACSTITLERGEIAIDKNNLALKGPSDHALTIDAGYASRVLNHSGFGYLRATDLDFTRGAGGDGGCIRSAGNLVLEHSTVSACSSSGRGGGIYARAATIKYSSVSGNTAYLRGGGIYGSYGYVVLKHSSVDGNAAFGDYGRGGGAYGSVKAYFSSFTGNQAHDKGGGIGGAVLLYDSHVTGNSADTRGGGVDAGLAYLTRTTISGNSAPKDGGIYTYQLVADQSTIDSNTALGTGGGGFAFDAKLINSTISGNHAGCVGGLFAGYLDVANSTIAFNASSSYDTDCAGGIAAYFSKVASTIVAKNRRKGFGFADFQVLDPPNFPDPGYLVANTSLIVSANVVTPSLTSDPLLTPLAFHGGAVRTHAFRADSPVIDAGSNPQNVDTDARGAGFVRSAGAGVDIGAYERQVSDDALFYDGFD